MAVPGLTEMNLDRFCAEQGHRCADAVVQALSNDAKKAETLIITSLAVLQEQGLYAFVLFCRARGSGEDTGARKLEEVAKDLLTSPPLQLTGGGDLLEEVRKENGLASNLDRLLLTCRILEQTLIYARYHAKAMKAKGAPAGSAGTP